MNEVEKLNVACYFLINKLLEMNAQSMTINQTGVTFKGTFVGDWEVVVRRRGEPDLPADEDIDLE